MARKKKEFNKNGTFQRRFTDLWYKSGKTQEQLAKALSVTRPTVVGWSDGKNLPDIDSLERRARLFDVSADYLLGLSDTVSPDASLRAAAEYTGLSETALERLHGGLADLEYGSGEISDEEKRKNLSATSMLLESTAFIKMLQNLREVSFSAYAEKILEILWNERIECSQSTEDDLFQFGREEDRRVVVNNLAEIYRLRDFFSGMNYFEEVSKIPDFELMGHVFELMATYRNKSELHQFHAAKAFAGYMDQSIAKERQNAEEKLLEKV